MKSIISEPVKIQVFALVILFVTAIIVIYSINSYVNYVTEEYDKEIINNRAEASLGKILSGKLFEIENDFIKIANTSKIKDIKKYSESIYSSINSIENILKILQNSGTYKETIPVNIINKDQIQEKIDFTQKNRGYVIEVIELSPKINEIKTGTDTLVKIVSNIIIYSGNDLIKREEKKIILLMKQINTYFRRSHESVNKIFYDTTIKIQKLELQKEKSNDILKIIKYIIYFLTFLIAGIITFFIFKKIGILLKERNENLLKIKENNKTIQKIFDVMPAGVMIVDKNRKIRQINNTALKLFKVENKEDIVSSNCINCFDIALEGRCPFDDKIPLKDIELNLLTSGGEKIPIIKSVMPIIIGNEEFLLEAFMDITDQRKIEEQLKTAKEEAEESNRLKSAFLANMSHEIRTPMNGIMGFAQFLTKPDITEKKVKKYSKIIIKSGDHLLNIINDIIDIAKIESGQLVINESGININLLMKELYSFFNSFINKNKNKKVKLIINLPLPDNKVNIKTDPTRLKQILTNLINNAVKFTEKGFIDIGYTINKDKITFYVKDSGIGIAKDKHKIIFERFNQAADSIEKLYGGTGLGLSISKACIEKLGGEIWLESDINKGSEFYFTIPYIKGAIIKEKKDVSISDVTDFKQASVLVVEDDLINYALFEEILGKYNLNLMHAETAEEAINIIRSDGIVDLVLMDIQLPGKDGNYAIEEIKKIKPNLPIVAQTAYVFDNEKELSISAGCDDYITKPIVVNEVHDILIKYLQKQ